jgi:holliday junction DNA helicase RuvA
MIALLTGKPLVINHSLVMDVGGVGYGVSVTASTLSQVANLTETSLYIHTHVREDNLELFGFLQVEEKVMFGHLIAISGVGPRTALGILEKGSQAIIQAVQQADVKVFSSVPRVGKKLAQKLIIELKSKLGGLKELDLAPLDSFQQDVSNALQALGFDESDIDQMLKQQDMQGMSLEQAVQESLKSFGQQSGLSQTSQSQ